MQYFQTALAILISGSFAIFSLIPSVTMKEPQSDLGQDLPYNVFGYMVFLLSTTLDYLS
jgi:hypothetical protein